MSEQNQTVFHMERIYLKDMSYEAPTVPQSFMENSAPEISIQLNINHSEINKDEGIFEVVLTLTATAKLKDETVFLIEVQQAGIFRLKNIPENNLLQLLEVTCPSLLFPFAGETINSLVTKGGFPQLLINPINFEHIYEQKQLAMKNEAKH